MKSQVSSPISSCSSNTDLLNDKYEHPPLAPFTKFLWKTQWEKLSAVKVTKKSIFKRKSKRLEIDQSFDEELCRRSRYRNTGSK